ncbi:MAG TPA: hypothetical protein VD902_19280 [Symbiobacteriaceae bacterium]|nr:hypothetical protein [Symbiobacteriaceae bacterium]
MTIKWRDVRHQQTAFLAEFAQGENCWASARLIILKGPRYLVKLEVRCVGKKPWVFERQYMRLPFAIDTYNRKKAEAIRRLEEN